VTASAMLFVDLPAQISLPDGASLEVSALSQSDSGALHAIELAAHSHPMSASLFEGNLQRYHAIGLKDQKGWIGFALISLVAGEAELLDFVVAPQQQGRGIGSAFLQWLIDRLSNKAERFYLEVRASNEPAIHLYGNAGFVEMGIRENYYPAKNGREDAILMAMELLD